MPQTLLTGGVADPSASQKAKGKRKARPEEEELNASSDDNIPAIGEGAQPSTHRPDRRVYSQHKVRTSLKDRTLDSMFPIAHPSQRPSKDSADDGSAIPVTQPASKEREIKEAECYLKSVRDLRAAVVKAKHSRECLLHCTSTAIILMSPLCRPYAHRAQRNSR